MIIKRIVAISLLSGLALMGLIMLVGLVAPTSMLEKFSKDPTKVVVAVDKNGKVIEGASVKVNADGTTVVVDASGQQVSGASAGTASASTTTATTTTSTTTTPSNGGSTTTTPPATGGGSTTPTTPTAPAAPSVSSFTASPSSIAYNASSTLSWASSNASTCTINNGLGTFGASGTKSTGALTATKTYTITCSGSGTASKSVTVTVAAAPVVTYCGGKTPCYGKSDMAAHATSGNCWSYQTASGSSSVYNMSSYNNVHKDGKKSEILAGCGGAINWSGVPSNSKHTSAKANTQATFNSYRVGYYDAAKP